MLDRKLVNAPAAADLFQPTKLQLNPEMWKVGIQGSKKESILLFRNYVHVCFERIIHIEVNGAKLYR